MDDTDPELKLNDIGVCWYCNEWVQHKQNYGWLPKDEGIQAWEKLVDFLKLNGQRKPYDCIIGVSGGVDSTYLAYATKLYGLKALILTVSTGFESEESISNLAKIVTYTGFDTKVCTVPQEAFAKVQRAYIYSGVIDTDVPADYLIEAFIRNVAHELDIHYIFSGGNYYSDAFMPSTWTYVNKLDYTNLRNICRKFQAEDALNQFPKLTAWDNIMFKYLYGLKYITPLNMIGYDRGIAVKTLKYVMGFQYYGQKHYENIFTRWYQGHVLPSRAGIDKRKANLSNYIRAGGISRRQALDELKKPNYNSITLQEDIRFIAKKLDLSENYLDNFLYAPIVPHEQFGSDRWIYTLIEKPYLKTRRTVGKLLRKIGVMKK